jgi:hypothetical protein
MACDKLGGLACKVSHLTCNEVEWLMSEIKKVFGGDVE